MAEEIWASGPIQLADGRTVGLRVIVPEGLVDPPQPPEVDPLFSFTVTEGDHEEDLPMTMEQAHALKRALEAARAQAQGWKGVRQSKW
jgi:hypothetical protein